MVVIQRPLATLLITSAGLMTSIGLLGCTAEQPAPPASWPAPDYGELATGLDDPSGVEPGDKAVLSASPVESVGVGRFVMSKACSMCHSNSVYATAMRGSEGEDLAPFNLWQATMMANAARDPFWRAMVSAEMELTPSRADDIETKCIRCHAPMASVTAQDWNVDVKLSWATMGDSAEGQVFVDGVACATCHQIKPDNLGQEESLSGGFEIGTERLIFGPHRQPATGPMQHHVDYTPTYGPHVLKAELCATCHTLETHAIAADGQDIDGATYLEQSPFLEWKTSDYWQEDSASAVGCQDCHMPTTDDQGEIIETRIARSPPGGDFNINARKPFGRHLFVGANTALPQIINRERAVLNPQATPAAFDGVVEMARRRLREDTATIDIEEVKTRGGRLVFGVRVSSMVGHKLPTGFPSRRVFLHVRVLDAEGEVLFESGAFDDEGRLTAGGDVLDIEKAGGPIEPHRSLVRRPDQVAIFEQVMVDADGKPTFSVLRATGRAKDNRILPVGSGPQKDGFERIAPVGTEADGNFVGGSSVVRFAVEPGAAPARVEARLYYQGLSPRFLREVFQVDTPEVRAFRSMVADEDVMPELIRDASHDL